MTTANPDAQAQISMATRVVIRVVAYYIVVLGLFAFAWPYLGRFERATQASLQALLGGAIGLTAAPAARIGPLGSLVPVGGTVDSPVAGSTLAVTVVLAMVGALVFALPVSWIFVLTRAKRGYQQSVVQTLVMLPMVVAGVVVLVKDSLALAFGLAGIVAAVRFRTALDDSKDAIYVFLATGIGLAAAVDLPVAAAISLCFNAAILVLWRTDFGRSPLRLEGPVARERLRRAREMAQTGTFVARMDDEVFRNMTAEQLESVAERARRRARLHDPDAPAGNGTDPEESETLLLIRTVDVAAARLIVDPILEGQARRWRYGGATVSTNGTQVLDYSVELKKGKQPAVLVDLLRAANAPSVLAVELG